MKKILLYLTVIMLFSSCDPPQNEWVWVVVNSTERTLLLNFPYYRGYNMETIAPGGVIALSRTTTNTGKRHNMYFDDYFKKFVGEYGEDAYWQILYDGNVIKTWTYSDRGLPDQRFFDESSWRHRQEEGGGFVVTRFTWTFEISPEDIVSE